MGLGLCWSGALCTTCVDGELSPSSTPGPGHVWFMAESVKSLLSAVWDRKKLDFSLSLTTPWRRMWEWMYRYEVHVFLFSALLGDLSSWRHDHFIPANRAPAPIRYEVGWAIWGSENPWTSQDSICGPNVVHLVANRYIDWATAAHTRGQ
jgi:hypothetical protein